MPEIAYNILIVDDNPNNLFTLNSLLCELDGVQVLEASSGVEALTITLQQDINLILLDIQMPGMDGYETAQHLKSTARTKHIPIVFVSAVFIGEEFVSRGYKVGAIDYLTKPIDDNLLLNRITHYKQLYQREAELLQIQQQLQKHKDELEETIDKRTRELDEARRRAEAANDAKSQFLASMSHEIRTPMNAIIGLVDVTLETELSEDQKSWLKIVSSSSYSLLGLINDILDFAKIDAGKLELQAHSCMLKKTVESIFTTMEQQFNAKNLEFKMVIDPNVPEWVLCDELRIRQILINLVGNALKFTHKGEINVSLENISVNPFGDTVTLEVCVSDTGIGIAPEKLNQIFESFSQVHDETGTDYGGTGLGLSISKHLVHLMDGDIWVESVEGQGSKFYFTLTLGKSQAKPNPKILDELPDIKGVKILLVEDNLINQKLAIAILKKGEAEVKIAVNGKLALTDLALDDFDVVLMDIKMPVMNGWDSALAIRSGESGVRDPNIPIIAMTANAFDEDKQKCFSVGMNDFLAKPIKKLSLYQAIYKQWKGEKSNE
ncbi:MAG: response regulator [SAR324 cluster bacterium]|nr:response regulator [SAR324 cluster bacterium]